MNYAEKLKGMYPKKRTLEEIKIVREKVKGTMYHIPQSINSPQDAFDTIMGIMDLEKETQELFGVLALNTKNQVVGFDIIHKGTVNASLVSPRDIFKCLLLRNSTSFICFHNHPSGDPSPSAEDKEVTKKIKSAGEILDIKLLDHVITGDHGKYVSLKERGVL